MIPNPFAAAPTDPDEVTLSIGGKKWRFWDGLALTSSIDTFDSVAFSAGFEAERQEFKDTFRPFSFKPLAVDIGGERFLTGTMVGVVPEIDVDSRTVAVSGYSKPGVLCDCDAPASLLPFESNGLTLEQIAESICAPFGLTVVFEGASGGSFKRVKMPNHRKRRLPGVKKELEAGANLHGFLVELAKQRGFVITNTTDGELLFWRSTSSGSPVARLDARKPPILSVKPTFNPQEYFSEITGYVPHRKGQKGARYTQKNARLAGVLRSSSWKLDDIEKGDGPAAVHAALGRMFAGAVSYELDVPTWRDPKGRLWARNTTLKLIAPDAMIYTEYEFLIRTVTLRQDADSKTATLHLVMPGAFDGEVPPLLPWD